MNRRLAAGAALAAAVAFPGCLGDPPIEERWTLLEIVDAQPTDLAAFAVGSGTPVTMKARITYRELLTGFVVAELRGSPLLTAADTRLDREEHHLDKARDVDLILQNSISLGTQAVPVTGWDHLVQEIDLSFDAGVVAPTAADSSVAAAGSQTLDASGLFLVLYFSDDVEEVELASGEEIEVVTPVFSTERDILATGLEIAAAPQE